MSAFEFRLIFRQKASVLSNVLGPVLVLAFPFLVQPQTEEQWIGLMAPSCVFVLLFTLYITTTSSVTARRDMQLFKRLRTSELSPAQMLTALLIPLTALGVLQVLVIVTGFVLLGAPVPTEAPLLVIGILFTALLAVVAGIATGMIASDGEKVQFAVLPLVLLAAGAANLVITPIPDPFRLAVLFAPFATGADLIARGSGAPAELLYAPSIPVPMALLDLALLSLWAAIFALVARANWRWEPRG